jgi:hypothetical protein
LKKCAGVRIDRILRDKRTRQPDPNTVPLTSTLYPTYSNKILLLLTVIFSFILGTSLVFFVELFSSQPFISNTHLHCKLYIFSGYFPSIKRHTCSTQNKKKEMKTKTTGTSDSYIYNEMAVFEHQNLDAPSFF